MAEPRKRGFSSMEKAKQREIASKGGKAAHVKGTAHQFTSDEAREAGRKGGAASKARRQKDRNVEAAPQTNGHDTGQFPPVEGAIVQSVEGS